MPFLVVCAIVVVLAVAFPGFTKFLNYGLLFPFVSVAIGSLSWCVLGMLSDGLASLFTWICCVVFLGIPLGLKIAHFSES